MYKKEMDQIKEENKTKKAMVILVYFNEYVLFFRNKKVGK